MKDLSTIQPLPTGLEIARAILEPLPSQFVKHELKIDGNFAVKTKENKKVKSSHGVMSLLSALETMRSVENVHFN